MKKIILSLILLLVHACSTHDDPATELIFVEQESGIDPYTTRMIITRDFLRIDDGPDSEDFILFDRKSRKISSVSLENGRIFEINPREIELEKPADLVWEHRIVDAKGAPAINHIQPTGHSFSANQQTCLQVMAAKGLLESARLALIEYQTVLAGEHAANFNKTPSEQRQACDTALGIFHAADSLQYGFPLIEWDAAGHRRQLESFTENKVISNDLFKLPEGLEVFSSHH